MHSKGQSHNSMFSRWTSVNVTIAIMLTLLFLIFLILFMFLAAQPAQAQTYRVIYNFTGGADQGAPAAGLSIDPMGNLYGTAYGGVQGEDLGCGTVFKLARSGSAWVYSTLHTFGGGRHRDGCDPVGRVVFGPDGHLYGTTEVGGDGAIVSGNWGVVFDVTPGPIAGEEWTESVLYRFRKGSDGKDPQSELNFDSAGNAYGTTISGGGIGCAGHGCGTVYLLSPSSAGWRESIIHSFGGPDGAAPFAGVIFDAAGNIYGTTRSGGFTGGNCGSQGGCGLVFQLTPTAEGWTENVLYRFQWGDDGAFPQGGLLMDSAGNLYGTAVRGGTADAGTVFVLSPVNGGWSYKTLFSFQSYGTGAYPIASLIMDRAGNLYGTTSGGTVFELSPSQNSWIFKLLHTFSGWDGNDPRGSLILDPQGHLYGTTYWGGTGGGCDGIGCGVAFEITP